MTEHTPPAEGQPLIILSAATPGRPTTTCRTLADTAPAHLLLGRPAESQTPATTAASYDSRNTSGSSQRA